jgi:hypothetical protein
MPMGGGAVGFVAFVVVKFAGYTAAAHYLGKGYEQPTNIWKVGGTRTIIGMAVGAAYWGAWSYSSLAPHPLLWFLALIPIRVMEWGALLRIFFDRKLFESSRSWKYAVYGTIWSFVLDAIGVGAALVVPGGVWIC